MKTILPEEYTEATNCSEAILGRRLPYISFENVQAFLNKRGYDVIVHRGEYENLKMTESVPGEGTVRIVGTANVMISVILAVKPNTILPAIVSSEECKNLYIWKVFEEELVKKLLFE
jgi:hypothetical protein